MEKRLIPWMPDLRSLDNNGMAVQANPLAAAASLPQAMSARRVYSTLVIAQVPSPSSAAECWTFTNIVPGSFPK